MHFPQDTLGQLVRSHIAEQAKRFDSTEELLQSKRDDLRAAQLLSGNAHDTWSQGSVHLTTKLHSESAQDETSVAAFSDSSPASHRFDATYKDSLLESTDYGVHRTIHNAIESAPIILSLQHAILRLENHLTRAIERQENSEARIRSLEDERETLRLEVQALSDLSVKHSSVIAELRMALAGSIESLPRHAPQNANERSLTRAADLRETQALLTTALQEDTVTAAALIGNRGSRTSAAGSHATPSAKETVCDQCFSRSLCTPCGNCGSEWYCSANCALLRRDKHRPACDLLRGR